MTLGIDIGGTNIGLGLVEGSAVVKKTTVPSFAPDASLEDTLSYLADQISTIICPEVEKIGIGVPSVVDPLRGIVYNAVNIPSWDVVPLKERMEKRFGLPVSVNNDANCYALGASVMSEPSQVLVAVTLGTGTGVGIVTGGELFSGPHCGAGEIASLPYQGKDYESYCSKKYFHDRNISPKQLYTRAAAGDPEALGLFHDFGYHLGQFLSVVMFAYDADRIVLGGGIAHSYRFFCDSMTDSLREAYPYSKTLEDLSITAMPDGDVALIGAASL